MLENTDVRKILKRALKNGGDFAELFEEQSAGTSLQREMRQFKKVLYGLDAGIGLRVLFQGKTTYAFTNELTEKALLALADQVASALRLGKFDKPFALKPQSPNWRPVVEIDPAQVPVEAKAKLLTQADEIAWQDDPRIRQVSLSYRDQIRQIRIANSLGQWSEERQVYVVFVAQIVAADGDVLQTGYEPLGGTSGFELLQGEAALKVTQLARERALLLLASPVAPSGVMPVVLASESGGTMVHEAVGHGLEADLALEGLSVYQNKLGEKVGNNLITVLDDPTVPGKRGSFQFDDEGTPAQRNVLVDRGILKNYMFNRRYAMQQGVSSTGNGRRESYQYPPIVRMTNTMIASGKDDPQAILQSVHRGLLVKRMGSGQVNTVNGDFVFEVSEGWMIENGKIDHSVRGATLTGNGPQVLHAIDMVGSDLGFGIGTCGKDGQGVPVADAQPTLRIPEITVGGSST